VIIWDGLRDGLVTAWSWLLPRWWMALLPYALAAVPALAAVLWVLDRRDSRHG
jgi:hypothetical protein